jgi:hypothetical protein
MIRGIVSKGFFLRATPRRCSTLVCVLKADHMIYINEVARLVSVEPYGGVGFVTAIVEV